MLFGIAVLQLASRWNQRKLRQRQPTVRLLDVVKRIAVALTVTIDELAFGDDRGPGDDLRLHLEAASRLDPDEQHVVRSVIKALSVKHEARRWNDTSPAR